jgi:uncharacterized protein YecT (DUF1311 family)
MKHLYLLVVLLSMRLLSAAQMDGPKEITPAILQKITLEAEKVTAAFRKTLTSDEWSADRAEFCADTFKINLIVSKRMDIDFTTVGMNHTVMESTAAYDRLMNKYYNKLIKLLKPEDKKILVAAQKAWLAFRDAEHKLIGITRKEEYSGGGTIQTNIAVGMYASLVETRTFEIFNYFDEIIKEK